MLLESSFLGNVCLCFRQSSSDQEHFLWYRSECDIEPSQPTRLNAYRAPPRVVRGLHHFCVRLRQRTVPNDISEPNEYPQYLFGMVGMASLPLSGNIGPARAHGTTFLLLGLVAKGPELPYVVRSSPCVHTRYQNSYLSAAARKTARRSSVHVPTNSTWMKNVSKPRGRAQGRQGGLGREGGREGR